MKNTVSRQLRWQIKKQSQGLCAICGKPSNKQYRCDTCRIKRRRAARISVQVLPILGEVS